jgi:N-acylneuraminate cytidylyltransferase
MANLCIIPARGGSKRIPRKNIRDFLGKPMLAYPVSNAIASGLFDEIMVSTDDAEIAEIAIQSKAGVPFFRSVETAGDTATTASVISEVLENYTSIGKEFDYVCCLYPCTPLLTPQRIIDGFTAISDRRLHTVLTVQEFDFPVQRALKVVNDEVRFMFPEFALTRSQDLDTLYHDAGQFYWLEVNKFMKTKTIIGEKCGYVVLSGMDAQDIDNESDWKMAELKYRMKFNIHANI